MLAQSIANHKERRDDENQEFLHNEKWKRIGRIIEVRRHHLLARTRLVRLRIKKRVMVIVGTDWDGTSCKIYHKA